MPLLVWLLLTHTFSFCTPLPTDNQPGPMSPVKYTTFSYGGLRNTSLCITDPSPMADTKSPPHLKHNPPSQLSSPPQVSSRPSVLPQARRLPFLALKNVGVLSQGPQQHSSPSTSRPPEHTSPEHPQEGTPRSHPGVHGCIPGRPLRTTRPRPDRGAPHPPGAAPRGPLGRARLP